MAETRLVLKYAGWFLAGITSIGCLPLAAEPLEVEPDSVEQPAGAPQPPGNVQLEADRQFYDQRRGVTIDIRAPRQHARFIERRGAILRHSMHTTEEQMQREGLTVTFDTLLANAIFFWEMRSHTLGESPLTTSCSADSLRCCPRSRSTTTVVASTPSRRQW